ncbi:hypothetical protein D1AOALGA4SA_8763 [Olavius algarvensis Delta 1 endosymbiont]|nr:hypothetical protein D1AOALGA4SA_8763 [Olavius algarvensis Delta 1 endosymbiont]
MICRVFNFTGGFPPVKLFLATAEISPFNAVLKSKDPDPETRL